MVIPMRQLLAAIALIGAAVVAARLVERANEEAIDAGSARPMTALGSETRSDTAPASAPTIARALGSLAVRGLDGNRVALATPGQPLVVMVSSETCAWCKRALKDLGELSAGRPLTRLTVITLEGAAEGAPMLAREGITGARLVGPADGADQVLFTFRFPGTPTFVAIDRNGRVVKTLPGYPIRAEMRRWFAVMVGDQDTP